MEFRVLAEQFERLEKASKRLELTAGVIALLKATPRDLVDKVLYLTQGRLYPDFVGIELGVAEKLTVRALSKTLGLKEEEVVALQKKLGDIGTAAEEVLKRRRQRTFSDAKLTVEHVYGTFEKIAKSTGAGSQETKLRLLGELLHNASPLEGRYLVRLVTGKLRLGVADQTLLEALALHAANREALSVVDLDEKDRKEREEAKRAVEKAMQVTSDIALVAKALIEGGLPAVRRLKVRLGVPIRPMLAERTETLEEAMERMGGVAQVEYKYDGLRVQAHVGDDVDLFSRRLERITGQFPDLVEAAAAARKGRKAFIVEGEAVAVDPKTGRIRPFQELATRRGRKYGLGGEGDGQGKLTDLDYTKKVPVRLFLFDVLHHDGEEVMDRPLRERRKMLATLFKENDRIVLAEAAEFDAVKDVEAYFERVTSMGAEGIMLKNPGSSYQAGNRGWSWIKFKADYQAGSVDSFDLVVVGAYWGQGRRSGWYGALLLAALNEKTGDFEAVTRLATGFDDATLMGLEERFRPYVSKTKPKRVVSEEVPDVWLEPKPVIEVQGAELTLSPRYTVARGVFRGDAGLSVRFPRFTGRWRDDKKPDQATTDKELAKFYRARIAAQARKAA
jgi:DNA ligase 1